MNNLTTSTFSQAQAYFESGVQYYEQEKLSEALKDFEQAKVLFEAHENWQNYLQCYKHIVSMFIRQLYHSEAEQVIQDTIQFAKEKKIENTTEMADFYLEASVLYAEMAKWEKCFQFCLVAEEIYKNVLGNTSSKLGFFYTQIAAYYNIVGDIDKSFRYSQKALEIFKISEDEEGLSMCYYVIGQYFAKIKQEKKAIEYYQKSLKYLPPYNNGINANVAMVYIYIGKAYVSQEEFQEGMSYFQRALTIAEELSDDLTIAFIHSRIGSTYHKRGIPYFVQARSHLKKAIQIHEKALGLYHPKVSMDYYGIALMYAIEQEYSLAWSFNQKAFEALDSTYRSKTKNLREIALRFLAEKKMFDSIFIFLEQRANILYELYQQDKGSIDNLQKSFDTYQLIGDLIAQFYDENTSKVTKLEIRKKGKRTYGKNIAIGMELQQLTPNTAHYHSKIFEASEKSKAALLFADIQSTTAKLEAQIPAELLEEEQGLRKKWKELEKKMEIASQAKTRENLTQINTWRGELFDLQRAHEKLEQQLESDFPQYYQLKRQLPILGLSELQAVLSQQPNLSIVSYFVGETKMYVFLVQEAHFEVIEIEKPTDLAEKILDFVDAINLSFREEYVELAYELYQLLIEPISALLKQKAPPAVEHAPISLLILPDDVLSQLPFEALLSRPVNASNTFEDLPYLLLDYEIQYHYSASLWKYDLNHATRTTAHPSNSFVGFAPVYANKLLQEQQTKEHLDVAYHERSTRSVRIRGEVFQELLYSEKEVKGICQLFEQEGIPTQVFLHEQASVPQFREAISDHKYVHISAHSFPNLEEANLSGIVFSPTANASVETASEIDYVFYLQDAYLLNLKADLVVLSCCETGVGQLAKGEGMLAMNRGFLAAGAKNVIYTLFKVYDAASSELTQKLFRHILAGKSYATALRLAKLEMLEGTTALPKFWAGYVMIGV
ncbi:MAG: CHAT domain-containing protein [Chitinophagales bacterium]